MNRTEFDDGLGFSRALGILVAVLIGLCVVRVLGLSVWMIPVMLAIGSVQAFTALAFDEEWFGLHDHLADRLGIGNRR